MDEREAFLAAIDIDSPNERSAYLDAVCAGDDALRERLDALLRVHSEEETFLRQPFVRRDEADCLYEGPGSVIGRYKLLEKIGEGGFGAVYMAEQRDPVQRRVALKIIKLGMDTKQVVGRFEAERQALALMDHPNIAKVFDGGATRTGRPYFVMELVNGVPITEFCDTTRLDTHKRLELFVQVCDAVQHAHQKGLIHRDLKPSNVMVTLHDDKVVPKVIDFGVAKATRQRLTEKTFFTQFQHLIGTPLYMSPEQATFNSLDIDTRSDIYSLGVLLYELITGTTPLDGRRLQSTGYDELCRIIREDQPPVPSTRISTLGDQLQTVADNRRMDPRVLRRTIRGELDWIVMKALEKDRTRRYKTANTLASDIQRYLRHEPVAAGPPSKAYRLRKFARRNRSLVFSGLLVLLMLIIGATASTMGLFFALQANREANMARMRAEENELEAMQNAYAADMNVALTALQLNDRQQIKELVARHYPERGQLDLRGWEWRYLWQHCQSDALLQLVHHDNMVFQLDFSHDGKYLAAGLWDRQLEVWDFEERRLVGGFEHSGQIVAVAFSPSANILASSSKHGDLKICKEPAFERATASFDAGAPLRSLSFSPDGQWLAAYATDRTVRLWETETLTPRGKFPTTVHVGAFAGVVRFTPDSSRLIVGDPRGGTVRVLAVPSGDELGWKTTLKNSLGNAPDLLTQAAEVADLEFSPDGQILASSGRNMEIMFWDSQTGEQLGRLEGARNVIDIAFSPDGSQLACTANDGTVSLWDVTERQPIAQLKGHLRPVRSIAYSPSGATFVSGSDDGQILVWRGEPKISRPAHQVLKGKRYPVFSPDSRTLAVVDDDQQVVLISMEDEKERRLADLGPIALAEWPIRRLPLLFSPDGTMLAATADNGDLKIWNLAEQRLETTISADVNGICAVKFLPNSRRLITTHRRHASNVEHDLRAWEIGTWQNKPLQAHITDMIVSVDVSNNERMMVTSHEDGRVLLWRPSDDGQPFLLGRFSRGRPVCFSPDDQLVAVGNELGSAKVWRLSDGSETTLRGDYVRSLSFSADSNRLAVAGATLQLWDMATFRRLGVLPTGKDVIASFSPDGNILAASDEQGNLHIWRAPTWKEINNRDARGSARGGSIQSRMRPHHLLE